MKKLIDGAMRPRQREVYFGGLLGRKPKIPVRLDLLELKARKKLSKKFISSIDGSAGYENNITRNNEAFKKWAIVQRVLTGITEYDTSVNLFGEIHSYPILLAPVGINELVNKKAEPAAARAAALEDIAMAFSTQASTPMEKVSAVMGDSKRWFQLYWQNDEFNESLIRRAEACGCTALIVTADLQVYGWRTEELELGFQPVLHNFKGMAQYSSDPVFLEQLDEYMKTKPLIPSMGLSFALIKNKISMAWHFRGSFWNNLLTNRALHAQQLQSSLWSKNIFTWESVAELKKKTKLPILVKGVQHPDDAKLAIKHGIDGIIVSNHGGRQVSGGITTLDALPDIVQAVQGKIPILFDSGIRGGGDIFKAIALGASAVLIGHPYLYALNLAGEDGVRELLQNLKTEFETTMILTGCETVGDVTPDKIKRVP